MAALPARAIVSILSRIAKSRKTTMRVNNLFDLGGKVALVTGGSRGLGLQMAEALGEMGAKVAITARKSDELKEAEATREVRHRDAHHRQRPVEVHSIPGVVEQVLARLAPWTSS
jgi:gluconate 5-dehydrogenase